MKITIDTKEDSHEEIRKIIRMLSSLVGEEVMTNQRDIFSGDSSQAETSDVFNIFNTNPENKTDEEKRDETQGNEKEEDDIDIPELEEYR